MDWESVITQEMLVNDFSAAEEIVQKYGQAIIVSNSSKKYILVDIGTKSSIIRSRKAANQPELERLLRSMGKGIFVKYFWNFRNDEDPFLFMAEEHFTDNSLRSRKSCARAIFNNGWECDALRMISGSSNVQPEYRARAEKLLEELSVEGSSL